MSGSTEKNEADFKAAKAAILKWPSRFLDDPEVLYALVRYKNADKAGNVYDMRDLALGRMRTRLEELQSQHDDVISVVHSNFASMLKIQRAVLAVIDCTSLDEFIETLSTSLFDILGVDALRLVMSTSLAERADLRAYKELRLLDKEDLHAFQIAGTRQQAAPVILRQVSWSPRQIFGSIAEDIHSEAILTLGNSEEIADILFVMGCKDKEQFSHDANTDLLEFFGSVLTICVYRWIGLER